MIYVEGSDQAQSAGCCQSIRPGREPLVKLTIVHGCHSMSILLSPDAAMRLGTTLGLDQVARSLKLLSEASITYVALGKAEGPPDSYDAVLELRAGGAWSWQPPRRVEGLA